ncbi:MAG: hypothetical protein BA870_04730 [Desulfuromonadales bacterium C00003094]|nr:MAG: hypothetical protein BA870_04730 [Desulfuromonadales bacterium C00003094]
MFFAKCIAHFLVTYDSAALSLRGWVSAANCSLQGEGWLEQVVIKKATKPQTLGVTSAGALLLFLV